MNQFLKVSFEQYEKDRGDGDVAAIEYAGIELPKRATKGSAGYDFFAPFDITLASGEEVRIPTGVKVELDSDKFLACYPRSGLGFKYKIRLANTVGIIDSDYFHAENEGHINIKIRNEGHSSVYIPRGSAFAQGIITQFFATDDDTANGVRTGGFGSTG